MKKNNIVVKIGDGNVVCQIRDKYWLVVSSNSSKNVGKIIYDLPNNYADANESIIGDKKDFYLRKKEMIDAAIKAYTDVAELLTYIVSHYDIIKNVNEFISFFKESAFSRIVDRYNIDPYMNISIDYENFIVKEYQVLKQSDPIINAAIIDTLKKMSGYEILYKSTVSRYDEINGYLSLQKHNKYRYIIYNYDTETTFVGNGDE